MKKRLFTALLVVVLCLSFCASAFAAVTPTVSKTALKAGEDVTLTLTLDDAHDDITSFGYRIFFDTDLFTLKSSTKGDVNPNTAISVKPVSKKDADGVSRPCYYVNFVDMASEGQTVSAGTIYTLVFTATEDVTEEQLTSFDVTSEAWMDASWATHTDFGKVEGGKIQMKISPAAAYEGYKISVEEDQEVVCGETAVVNVMVDSEDYDHFNAADITLTYDTAKLDLKTTAVDGWFIRNNAGTIRLMAFGEARDLGKAISLQFTAKAVGDANVTVTSAKIDEAAGAIDEDAPEATIETASAVITVKAYPVTLPDDFEGEDIAQPGEDYTFTAKDEHYDYDVEATVGGEDAEVIDNGDGTYTIEDVDGPIVITSTKTPKSYDVTVADAVKDDVTGAAKATYGTDYTFTIDKDDDYNYEDLTITVNGAAYTGYTVSGDAYTIPGADVTGPISISMTKTLKPPTTVAVSFEGTGAGDATGEAIATIGEDYTFTVAKETGFEYEISATMGGTAVEVKEADGKYVIENAQKDIVITIAKTEKIDVEVYEYVKLDGKVIYLVTASGTPADGKVYAYDGSAMFYSGQYDAYAWLLVSDKPIADVKAEAAAKISSIEATKVTISYSGDINGTNKVDINDAQLVYDMYNAKYEDFTKVSIEKFLRADLNNSKNLTTEDAAAVVDKIA